MHLMRIGRVGAEQPVVEHDGVRYDLRPLTSDIDGDFLAGGGIARVREALAAEKLQTFEGPDSVRIGPPVARPSAVICVGQNYAAHAAESGAEPPEVPIIFLKTPNTVVGPFDDVVVPPGSEKTDWEVELGIVIGQRASNLADEQEALGVIAGLVCSNDVSERAFQVEQSGGQWSKGKCAPTFNPLGPWLVPLDEIDDPQSLRLRSWVNGEPRQDSSTSDMIFTVAHLVHHLSHYLTLEPGDVINTGTPEGVAFSGRFPYLRAGDVMTLEIEGLGRMEQRLV